MPASFRNPFKRTAAPASQTSGFDATYAEALSAAAAHDLERAVRLYDEAIACDSSKAEPYYKRANALKDLGRLEAALASYGQAIERNCDCGFAYCNRGVVQHQLGMLTEALASYERATAIDPADAFSHHNRALVLQDCFRWNEALECYDRALAIDAGYAEAHYNRALTQLLLGDFERGWRGYEWRWKSAHRLSIGAARDFEQPLWLGGPNITGKRLLLHSEGGLGDTIQFSRYATLCARLGATVLLEVQPPLVELLTRLDGVTEVIPRGSALPAFDYHSPLMSLPLAFKTTLETIPAREAYLKCDPARVAQWRSLLGEPQCLRIGIAWGGNPSNPNDRRRSLRLADWIPHLPGGFHYFRLQRQMTEADEAALDSSESIFSFDDELLDFPGTAALCECMDLVVSVDTSLAHLSGALGRPTWVLLSHPADWRWMLERDDCPWYPTVELRRQRSTGDWDELLRRVATDLRGLVPHPLSPA